MNQSPRRKNLRYPSFDYATPGAYFVTMCVQKRLPLFGEITAEGMQLNDAGHLVESVWQGIARKYPGAESNDFIVMPDHFHGIVWLGTDPEVVANITLGSVVRWFKSISTARYADGVKTRNWRRFDGQLWQRGYYDEILRNGAAVESRVKYMESNPWRWRENRRLD
jgi:REP element-mobilizing transposase RayT